MMFTNTNQDLKEKKNRNIIITDEAKRNGSDGTSG